MCSINHDLKAIFIHVHKTGGSYVASVLKQYYGFETYYLKRPDHDKFCLNRVKNPNQKNYENRVHGVYNYYKTSRELNQRMGMTPQKWETYYKFTFIRNPYDRMISGWNHMNPKVPFSRYVHLKNHVPDMEYIHVFMNQVRHIVDERGRIVVQFIGKFETLEDDLDRVLTNLGVYYRIHNPYQRVNKHEHAHYSTYYDPLTLQVVNALIAEDLRAFHYPKCEKMEDFVVGEVKRDAREYTTEVNFESEAVPGEKNEDEDEDEGEIVDHPLPLIHAPAPVPTPVPLSEMVMMSHSLDRILSQLDRS